mmetsp:Transcript_12819/g.45390  ORF Transcript_12819/g.45390 Transcript_12819/m.45390 type:complete len:485 (-) Transcript_12819:54-1508(-)
MCGMHGTPVEVRKGPKSTTWYNACVLDVRGDAILVGFEDDVWPKREVPAYSVRRCPLDGCCAATDDDSFDPQVDEVVEVLLQSSETNPSGWFLGRVKTIRNSFYFISFVGSTKGSQQQQDVIVERSALRPCSPELPLEPACLTRRRVVVEEDLHAWVRSQDSLGCFSHVQRCAGLLVASCTSAASETAEPPDVLLVGEAHAVDLGEKILTQIHFKHQVDMQRFHDLREGLVERLAEMREYHSTLHKEVFTVEQHLVGKIIGKKGENINQVRERHEVDIQVLDDTSDPKGHGTLTTITVTGDSADSVRRAREELEFVTERMDLQPEQVGWILGKGYQNISDIARKTELSYARFDDKAGCLELCGLKHQVENARMLIEAHTEYLSVYKTMDEEQCAIQQGFEQLEATLGGASTVPSRWSNGAVAGPVASRRGRDVATTMPGVGPGAGKAAAVASRAASAAVGDAGVAGRGSGQRRSAKGGRKGGGK